MLQGIQRVVLVTGPSGAGRSTAINALEDFGFESIDNIPLSLIPRLIEGSERLPRPMALGIDVRNRDFSAEGLLEIHQALSTFDGLSCDLLYLDCAPDVLSRRYSETRRRHPLAPDESPSEGIARELALLEDVRARADVLIDTTNLTVHELRAEMESWFQYETGQEMALSLHSFSYKRGLPQGLDVAIDCRFLRNPHWQPDLRAFTGLDAPVAQYVAQDARYDGFVDRTLDLLLFMLPGCVEEGKAHFSVGFGCTGGQHRSVSVTEHVAAALAQEGWRVSIRHRELERRGLTSASGRMPDKAGKAPQ
ncbi:RNase adapter RapZ [Tropicibacter oceani]|uniref:RNase adapter RapZ n=1 Tax=Tropicibacter oceani TaxID=3058420 RepID=A0ABY8QKK8_9RHOB|nr:RNase adapter RapZ [Tropicibacter oceani]WGW05175.1 RNase adapter RapZ [Tropicibacter oceani]